VAQQRGRAFRAGGVAGAARPAGRCAEMEYADEQGQAGGRDLAHDVGHAADAIDDVVHRFAGLVRQQAAAAAADILEGIGNAFLDFLGGGGRALRSVPEYWSIRVAQRHQQLAEFVAGIRMNVHAQIALRDAAGHGHRFQIHQFYLNG
jgi:hypothetical protein